MTLVRVLNWLSLAVLALAMLGDLAFLAMGTLFFDDPNIRYGDFLLWVTSPLLALIAVVAVCRAGSRRLARSGHSALAALVAALPVPLAVAGLGYIIGN